MNISCFACDPPTKWASESEYRDHLITFHGTESPDEALRLEKLKKANSPKLPLGVPPEAAPTPEFTKMMAEIDRAKASQATPPPVPALEVKRMPEGVKLTYKYTGQDSCGNNVNTLELDANGKHFVVAYCLFCQKQVEIREVVDLRKETQNGGVSIKSEVPVTKAVRRVPQAKKGTLSN